AALINITGDQNLTIREAELIVRKVSEKVNPNSEVIWGANINQSIKDYLCVAIIIISVSLSYFEKLIKDTEV
ncbi:MAG: hypothetical protein QXL24_04975, partial [Candidatus Jordarchaeaceae archaeon]